MARYEVLHQYKGLAFGEDHACGEFLMIWARPVDPEQRRLQDQFGPDPTEILVDLDTRFSKDFNRAVMKDTVQRHGFELSELENVYEGGKY